MGLILTKIKEYAALAAVVISLLGAGTSLVVANSAQAQRERIRVELYAPSYDEHVKLVAAAVADQKIDKLERQIDKLETKIDRLIGLAGGK
jgi:hypothetical protein